MKTPRDFSAERRALFFLQRGSLVRRSGGWRFGVARIPDAIVERLIEAGKAVHGTARSDARSARRSADMRVAAAIVLMLAILFGMTAAFRAVMVMPPSEVSTPR